MTNSFKSTTKSSSNNLILFENRQYVIWTVNTKNDFENWWTVDTSWKIDTTLRKREHRKLVWESKNRKKIVWANWHEVVNVTQNRSHILCKNCDFVSVHFTFENIDNNIMSKHRFNNECVFKKVSESKNKSFWKKVFNRYWNLFSFIYSIIDYFKTRFMRKKESFFRYTQQEFNDKLLKFVLNVNLSFRAIENSFFKKFVKYLRRNVEILERTFFEEMMKKRANQIKDDLFQNLEANLKIFIVLNVWISFNHLVFLDVTIYFIDCEFRFREMLIIFKSLFEQHTSEKLTEAIMNILQIYKFNRKLMTITVDNASNNVTLRKHLFEKLTKINVKWDSKIETINCMIHVLQLFVTALLIALRIQISNDDVNVRFNEKSLTEVFVSTFFENTLRKIIIHLSCLISID
jgi:hypothetical protein